MKLDQALYNANVSLTDLIKASSVALTSNSTPNHLAP